VPTNQSFYARQLGTSNLSISFDVLAAFGAIPGVRKFRKFGMNDDVDSGIEEIWPLGTVRTLPAAAGTISTVSSSANDTALGTGCRTMKVFGLDADWVEQEEEITLNGVTPVVSTNEYLRIYRSYIEQVGSGGVNEGNITVSIGGNAQSYIAADLGQSQQASYTVPADHTLMIASVEMSTGRIGAADLSLQLQMRLYDETIGAYLGWRSRVNVFPYETTWELGHIEGTRFIFPEKTDMRGITNGTPNNSQAHMEYSGFLIHNSFL
jgi:hypothetical protein